MNTQPTFISIDFCVLWSQFQWPIVLWGKLISDIFTNNKKSHYHKSIRSFPGCWFQLAAILKPSTKLYLSVFGLCHQVARLRSFKYRILGSFVSPIIPSTTCCSYLSPQSVSSSSKLHHHTFVSFLLSTLLRIKSPYDSHNVAVILFYSSMKIS